ncbi:MAG: YihY/virulence factor BrkB family protein [Chloroflexi bacterium]|nr:MAG: YihY/virulence factor BrkB family protein [Chloroflexota bacterium]
MTKRSRRRRTDITASRAKIQRLFERAQRTLPARVLTTYGESQASNYALALAFAGFLAMFPIMVGALAIIGLAIRDPATEAHFQTLVVQLFPSTAQPELQKAVHGVKQSAGWLGLLSLGGLLWSAGSIFSTMEFALTQIFGTKQRDMLRQRLMGLVMMLLLVVAIVLTVGLNSVAAFVPFKALGTIGDVLAWVTSFVLGAIVMVGLLVALYRFVPNRTFRVRDVLPGAVLAGVLIEVRSPGGSTPTVPSSLCSSCSRRGSTCSASLSCLVPYSTDSGSVHRPGKASWPARSRSRGPSRDLSTRSNRRNPKRKTRRPQGGRSSSA